MYCPKCGQENPDDAHVCRACGSVLSKAFVTTGVPIPRMSKLAIAAFVLGILGICTLGITIIPAIILGIISIVVIDKSGGRLTGRIFAVLGIVIPVIAFLIIFLLMMALMPALHRVKKQARSVECLSKLKYWGLYFSMYAEDHNSRFMAGFTAQPQANGWVTALGDYYKWNDEFTCCPNATKPWVDKYGVDSDAEGSGAGVTMAWGYMNPGHWKKPMKGSYGINGWIVDPQPDREPHPERGNSDYFWRGPSVAGARYVPLFLDAQHYTGVPLHHDRPPSYSGERWNDDTHMGRFCLNRHDGFVGCLLLDFSARKIGLKELWTLKWHRAYDTSGPWTMAGGAQPNKWPEWMRNFKDY